MTIITKPSIEKAFKLPLPLGFTNIGKDRLEKSLLEPKDLPYKGGDVESLHYTQPPALNCIKNSLTFLLIFITILLGMFGGYFIYRSFGPTEISTEKYYHTTCRIPYGALDNMTRAMELAGPMSYKGKHDSFFPALFNKPYPDVPEYFREEIEALLDDDDIDLIEHEKNEGYAKIYVPDFKDGRQGRFMHDFKENQSAIIDTSANHCFIMPLDRETTLPPRSFIDLMEKMSSGYYNIDTNLVRRRMRVKLPPVTDLTTISERIANECYDMQVYMLENDDSRISKREAQPLSEHGKFAGFSGKGIVEYDILNIAEIEEYEKQHKI